MQLSHTKIVATIGPASSDPRVIKSLVSAGMAVARLNFSHGTHEERKVQIKTLRETANNLGRPLGIMADMSGPKLRLGDLPDKKLVKKGEVLVFSHQPSNGEIPVQYDLAKFIKVGQRMFINDGLVEFTVMAISRGAITAKAVNSGWIDSHKGLNIPDTSLNGATFTDKDREDAVFALNEGVDFLALSFVERPQDLEEPRKLIERISPGTKIIVKIERKEAVENLTEIIKAADAVMVARGDLAIEVSPAEVPVITQKIIRICRQNQKPVIIATQMLESMIENPRPTRAEASDVANAVLIQADAVMLSAETANGKYPVETVATMKEIILSVEKSPEYKHYIRINWETIPQADIRFNALVSGAASIAYRIGAPVIIVGTASGRTAKMLAAFRPSALLVAATHDQKTRNQLNLVWGVEPVVVSPQKDIESFWQIMAGEIIVRKLAKKGSQIISVSGATGIGVSGATDTVRILQI